MTSNSPALSAEPDPSRRRLLAFGAAAVAAAAFADASSAAAPPSAPVSPDLSQLISSHRQTAESLEALNIEFGRLLDLPEVLSCPPPVDIALCSDVKQVANHWPMWAKDGDEIDELFDRLGPGCPSFWTEECRARAHAKYEEGRRQWEEVQERLGIPEQRATCLRVDAENEKYLNELTTFPFASIEDCRAAAEHLAAYMEKYERVDPLDPFHRFVLSLAGIDFSSESEEGDA